MPGASPRQSREQLCTRHVSTVGARDGTNTGGAPVGIRDGSPEGARVGARVGLAVEGCTVGGSVGMGGSQPQMLRGTARARMRRQVQVFCLSELVS